MSMIHKYSMNGYNIVLDVNGGSVHVVDDAAYRVLDFYKEKTKEETVELLKEKQIEVHRSDECKDIIFSSSGNGINTNCKAGSYNPGVNSKGNKNNNNKYVSYDTNISSSEDIKDTNKSDSNSEIVYWSKNGKKYHSDPTCSGMKNAISGTISESKRTPCSICY